MPTINEDSLHLTGYQARVFLDVIQLALRHVGNKRPMNGFCAAMDDVLDWYCERHLPTCSWNEVSNDFEIPFKTLRNMWTREWEHFSGDLIYPVPEREALSAHALPDDFLSPSEIYTATAHMGKMWDKRTEYGRLRWDYAYYLLHRAQQLNAELNNGEQSHERPQPINRV